MSEQVRVNERERIATSLRLRALATSDEVSRLAYTFDRPRHAIAKSHEAQVLREIADQIEQGAL